MTYDAVVFDNDGVLVGPTDFDVLHGAAWDAFEAVGVENPAPGDVEAMAGGVLPEELLAVADAYGFDAGEFWRARDRAASRAQQREMRAGRKTPYADVDVVADLGVPVGIVSSNQRETLDFQLDHFGMGHHFGTVWAREPTVESLHRKKPDPYFLERALADLGVESALFVGDNESDVEAAHNAGVDSAFIRRPHRVDHDLSVTPTHEVRDLHDVHGLVRAGADPPAGERGAGD